jgi:hypothetical protein
MAFTKNDFGYSLSHRFLQTIVIVRERLDC